MKRFKEKPDVETAKSFLKEGNFYWNSGMFYWKFGAINDAFEEYLPQVASLLEEIRLIWKNQNTKASIVDIYARMPKLPIDIGIMEKADKRTVIPVDYGWSDVGSWKALADISPTDTNGNFLPDQHLVIGSTNNYVSTDKFVSLIGVDNLCIIETDDAILVTSKERSEDVKKVVDTLTAEHQDNLL